MFIDTCSWDNPGTDRYQGTARSAIEAMSEIPAPVRAALIARTEKKVPDFDEVVMIDRETIRGKRAYAPELRNMAFGSKGRVCRTTTRDRWTDSHVETAMVYCESGWCIAQPVVCGNWSQIALAPQPPVPLLPPVALLAPADDLIDAPGLLLLPPSEAVPIVPVSGSPEAVPATFYRGVWGGGAWPGFVGGGAVGGGGGGGGAPGGHVGGYAVFCPPPESGQVVPPGGSVAPVPEPAVVISMLAGLALLSAVARKRATA